VVEDGAYERAVRIGGRPRLLRVHGDGDVEHPTLEVTLPDGPVAAAELDEAAALVARAFRVDEDPRPLEQRAAQDSVFGDLVARVRGLRALVMPTPFESLTWAIIGQQINVAFAYKLKRVLVERYGERLALGGREYFLFPDPERLASIEPEELRPRQFSGQKSRYIVDLARAVAGGQLDLESFAKLPAEEARAALVELRGVGRWTAEYVLMRGLAFRDELPAADVGLQVAAGRLYGLAVRPTEPELRTLAEPWAGWRTYYAFYLWFTLAPGLEHGEPRAGSQAAG
jgi:DNA-3-methyladenine glycosylase II